MSEANNITFAQAKTSFFYRPKVKRKYNTLHLAGKEVCKKDEENLVLFELNIKLLYGRYPNRYPFSLKQLLFYLGYNKVCNVVDAISHNCASRSADMSSSAKICTNGRNVYCAL